MQHILEIIIKNNLKEYLIIKVLQGLVLLSISMLKQTLLTKL